MPTFRRIRRAIAAILLVLYLPGCHHYVTPTDMTPQELIATKHPKQVRVTLQDVSRQTILDPFTSHDSLLGYIPVRQSNNFVRSGPLWAASLESIRRLEVYKLNTGKTVGMTAGLVIVTLVVGGIVAWAVVMSSIE